MESDFHLEIKNIAHTKCASDKLNNNCVQTERNDNKVHGLLVIL